MSGARFSRRCGALGGGHLRRHLGVGGGLASSGRTEPRLRNGHRVAGGRPDDLHPDDVALQVDYPAGAALATSPRGTKKRDACSAIQARRPAANRSGRLLTRSSPMACSAKRDRVRRSAHSSLPPLPHTPAARPHARPSALSAHADGRTNALVRHRAGPPPWRVPDNAPTSAPRPGPARCDCRTRPRSPCHRSGI